jgi:hypothetical protein
LDAPLDPANANRYAYAGGDPINSNDPTGHDAGGCVTGVLATVGSGLLLASLIGGEIATGGGDTLATVGSVILFTSAVGDADLQCGLGSTD